MREISRRQFGGALILAGAGMRCVRAASAGVGSVLETSLQQHKIPAAVAMAATSSKITYTGAFGKRDSKSGIAVTPDSVFMIASMTKPVTSVAAMQLVEQGKLKLEEPASTYIPELGTLQVLHGFDAAGKPILKPATKPVTLRTLLTHTSGFVYDTWDADMVRYEKVSGTSMPLGTVAPLTPLMFEPGTRWQYGTSADWSGRLVETVSGLTLEQYFQKNILEPLGMSDTSFLVPEAKFDRLVSEYSRQQPPDGPLAENPRTLPKPPKAFNGGGGLYSTASDYVRFMQMILRHGTRAEGRAYPAAEDRGYDGHQPNRRIERGQTEDPAADYFERRGFPSRLQRWLRVWFPHQREVVRWPAFRRKLGMGGRGEYLLLDRSSQRRGGRDHDAVPTIRRQRSARGAGGF